eukprot:Nitzschia sp. Nitz4//scaffold4_size323378//75751//77118//NITZ4_000636-RA/size323378-processed-gene-0.82-mRNA-1//1//CDS//3329553327//5041//frame0
MVYSDISYVPKCVKNAANPAFVKCISEDDDSDCMVPDAVIPEAEFFVDNYETMLQQQEAEMASLMRHLEPLLRILEHHSGVSPWETADKKAPWTKEFSYAQLERAVRTLQSDRKTRFIAADIQWKLVLETLVENSSGTQNREDETISWIEIVMCYRLCILGMQALQHAPSFVPVTRSRVRQRTMKMLSMFQAPSNSSIVHQQQPVEVNSTPKRSITRILQFGILVLVAVLYCLQDPSFMKLLDRVQSTFSDILHAGRTMETLEVRLVYDDIALSVGSPSAPSVVGSTLSSPLQPEAPVVVTGVGAKKSRRLSVKKIVKTPEMVRVSAANTASHPQQELAVSPSTDEGGYTFKEHTAVAPQPNSSGRIINLSGMALSGLVGTYAAGTTLGPFIASLWMSMPPFVSIGVTVAVSAFLTNQVPKYVEEVRGKLRNLLENHLDGVLPPQTTLRLSAILE